MKQVIGAAAAVICLLAAEAASAHHIWLEPDGAGLRLSFGEFGDNLRETSPGLLDKVEPQARIAAEGAGRPLALSKSSNGFAVAIEATPSGGVVAEDVRYPIFERKGESGTTRSMWWPAARFAAGSAPVKPVLTLDVVPAGDGRYQVFFQGKPLPKAKVEVIAAFGWTKEARTDETGTVAVVLPWRGLYAFEVHHSDKAAGKRGDEAYDGANYVTTLTYVQPSGLDMPPMPPAAKPH